VITILADTSALVSLEIKHLVDLASKHIQFSITKGVCEELKDIAEFDDTHGISARDVLKLVESGTIAVKSMPASEEHAQNIDMGEAEILTLSESGEYDYIITDDVKALPYIKSQTNTKTLTSAFVIRLLYDLKMLTRQDWYGGVLETISQRYFK